MDELTADNDIAIVTELKTVDVEDRSTTRSRIPKTELTAIEEELENGILSWDNATLQEAHKSDSELAFIMKKTRRLFREATLEGGRIPIEHHQVLVA